MKGYLGSPEHHDGRAVLGRDSDVAQATRAAPVRFRREDQAGRGVRNDPTYAQKGSKSRSHHPDCVRRSPLGDQFGWLDAEAWINLSPEGDLQGVLIGGLFILMFVFMDELRLTNNVDANGRAIEDDERARRVGSRTIVVIIAILVVAKLLFEIIVFFSGT